MARKKVAKQAPAPAASVTTAAPVVETKKAAPGASIGIDFGTHGVTIASYKHENYEIIVNSDGDKSTPLYVSFNDVERVIGAPARNAAVRNSANTVQYIRSYLGHKTADLHKVYTDVPYTVVDDANGDAAFKVTVQGADVVVTPDELITQFSQKLKTYADSYWDCSVTEAVVSVPLSFNEVARDRLIAAVEQAGFKVTAAITDPIAAALSFNLDSTVEHNDAKTVGSIYAPTSTVSGAKKTVLVIDIGCLESEMSIVTSNNGLLSVTDTDTATIGGSALDEKLFAHFAKQFQLKNGCDLTDSKRAVLRLQQACENVKKTLSITPQAGVQIDALYEGYDLFSDISRTKMEIMCEEVYTAFTQQLTTFFDRAHGVAPRDVTHVILAGGTAALTKFSTCIQNFFRRACGEFTATFLKHVNTGDTVAFGAAKQAYILATSPVAEVGPVKSAQSAAVAKLGVVAEVGVQGVDINKVTLPIYSQPSFALSKNVYAQTFQGTFVKIVGTETSAPSTSAVHFAVPHAIPEGYSAVVTLFESSADNAVDALKATDLKQIRQIVLNKNSIASAANNNGDGLVIATLRTTIDASFNLTMEIGYSSKASPDATFVTAFTSNLMAVAPVKVAHANTRSNEVAHTLYNTVARINQIQLLSKQYNSWKALPKNATFIATKDYIRAFVATADKLIADVAAIVALPNPYTDASDKAMTYFKANLATLPSVDDLDSKIIAIREALVHVIKTRSMTREEAYVLNANTARASKASSQEIDDDDDFDFDVDASDDDAAPEDDDEDEEADGDDDVDFDFGGCDLD